MDLEGPIILLIRDVDTHWNSTYEMMKISLDYREAIDTITQDCSNGLHAYELTDDKWRI